MQGPAPAPAPVYNDLQGLEQLKSEAAKDPSAALRKVAQQFEALFIQMMLKSMRDAGPAGGLFNSDNMKTYREMYDNQMAETMAGENNMGISNMLVRQLGGTVAKEEGAAATGTPATAVTGQVQAALRAYGAGAAPPVKIGPAGTIHE